MASGWNLWVWLQCIGVPSGCCCKEVYTCRYPHNNYYFPYSTCIGSFLAAASLLLCSKCFLGLYYIHYKVFTRPCRFNHTPKLSVCLLLLFITYTTR